LILGKNQSESGEQIPSSEKPKEEEHNHPDGLANSIIANATVAAWHGGSILPPAVQQNPIAASPPKLLSE
jgi:hypothetical protein